MKNLIEGQEYCNIWINGERSITRWSFVTRKAAEAHANEFLWLMRKMGAHIEFRWEVWRKDGIYA